MKYELTPQPSAEATHTAGQRFMWKIRVAGYGTFDFEGTEAEAEEMRRHKANWECRGGLKWRQTHQLPSDKISAQIAEMWDAQKGVPRDLLNKRFKALQAEGRLP